MSTSSIDSDVIIKGALTVRQGITGTMNRSGLIVDSDKKYPIYPWDWRVHDNIAVPLNAASEPVFAIHFNWTSASTDTCFFIADRDYRVVGITARVETTATTATAVVRKAPSATAIGSGTALHTGNINLASGASTNQTLTLSSTSTDLDIAAGTCIGFDLTITTMGSTTGAVTVFLSKTNTDDLLVAGSVYGTDCPYVTSGLQTGIASATRYARTLFTLPAEYNDGGLISINASAGCLSSAMGTSCTLDFECYKNARTCVKTGSDLVTTAAQSINSTTFAEKEFVITPTGLVAGDILDIRMTIASVGAAAGYPAVGACEMYLDVKG